jgi:hypothetical protein
MYDILLAIAMAVESVFDVFAMSARVLPAAGGLVVVSIPAGILMTVAFRLASPGNLDELRKAALSRITGMILHVDSPRSVLSLAASSLWRSGLFLVALVPPVLCASFPFMVTMGQIEARFGRRIPEGPQIVTIESESALEVPLAEAGARILPPVVRGDSPAVIAFRLEDGHPEGALLIGGCRAAVGSPSPGRPVPSGFVSSLPLGWNALLDPSIEVLGCAAGSGFTVRLALEPVAYRILGVRIGWLALYVVASSLWATIWFIAVRRR